MDKQKESVLLMLLPEYADWEASLLAPGLRRGFGLWKKTYNVEIVAPSMEPVLSIGGFKVTPDYCFDSAPDDFAALILVGGMNWFDDNGDAKGVLPLIHKATEKNALLGAICDASKFLAVEGFLNDVDHTSNELEALKTHAGSLYSGESQYQHLPSVRDGNIVTANGAGFIEFAQNIFLALDVAPEETIETFFETFKRGFI